MCIFVYILLCVYRMRLDEQGRTKLVAFFELNARELYNHSPYKPPAFEILYQDIPKYYTWMREMRYWKRKILSLHFQSIGRVYMVKPSEGEIFYLRLLLSSVKGAISFSDLRSYQDIQYNTFREAAEARGLLHNDTEYYKTLEEARIMIPGGDAVRNLFVSLLLHCDISNPKKFWNLYKDDICEDILYSYIQKWNASYDFSFFIFRVVNFMKNIFFRVPWF